MGAGPFAVCLLATLGLTLGLLRVYGNVSRSWPVTLVVVVAWFFSFSIVLILPIDVSAVRTCALPPPPPCLSGAP